MPKRLVKKISPINENQQNTIVPFNELLTERNIILLGEAGAGKSHLFELAKDYENGRYFKANSFSSFRGKCNHLVIYIDGLDEKRSRSDDFDSIDNIIEKIWTIKPEKLRLSCRVADWLGETDLQQFKDYFEENGGYCVVELQKLSDDEINSILEQKGIVDKRNFIEKVNEKGIDSLLKNPQTLIMLADVFNKNGQLPSSKQKLYDEAVTILLEESNEVHLDKTLWHYSIDLLKEAAGLICLSLLLANIESISLKQPKNHYAQLPFDKQILLAALSKRAFIVSNNHVIYAHRTIAEYLAACYLKELIQHKGLSITRVQNWLGFNGYPATELRGLYAWLTQLLPKYSYQLLTKDPYAVLVYGDVDCLTLSAKKALFKALVDLSEKNPWFRGNDWTSQPLGALSTAEMSEEFKTVLTQSTNFHLRSLVLDAITHGEVLHTELIAILLQLFCDDTVVYGERSRAFKALLRFDNGQQLIVKAVKEQLSNSEDSIRLKNEVITSIYTNNFTHHDVIELINNYVNTRHKISGSFWYLSYCLPIGELANILDGLLTIDIKNHEIEYDISSFCHKSIHRILIDKADIEADKLWSWLSSLPLNSGYHKNEIKDWLNEHRYYVMEIFQYALNNVEFKEDYNIWLFLEEFHSATYSILSNKEIISYLFNFISKKDSFNEKEQQIFSLILNLVIRSNPPEIELFNLLYDYGMTHCELTNIVEYSCKSEILDWRQKQTIKEQTRKKQKIETQQRNRTDFKKELDLVLTAQHFGWLEWLANVYFSRFADTDAKQTPKERLAEQLGEENVDFALAGLRAVINRTDLPTPNGIINLYINNKYQPWWYAILAGITEDYLIRRDLSLYSQQLLKSALAINLLYPSFYSREGNTISQITPNWQQALFEQQPELVQAVYLEIIETLAKAKKKYIEGIHIICTDLHLAKGRDCIVFKLLNDYPDINAQDLRTLLLTVLDYLDKRNELILLVKQALPKRIRLENRVLWLLIEFLIDFKKFKIRFEDKVLEKAIKNNKVISLVISFIETLSRNQKNAFQLSIEQLAFLINLIGSLSPNKQRPMISGAYRSLDCDKADFVKAQINQLSAQPNKEAAQILADLINEPKLASYSDDLKHALANQIVIYRQAQFNNNRLNWQTTIDALAKGKPANMADLHALTLEYLNDIAKTIRIGGNTDIYKVFWNDKNKDGVITQKREEYCRDRLIDLLRPKFALLDINVEPELHMANDKRADIVLLDSAKRKLPIEIKCDDHADIWEACEGQLQKFYTCDSQAHGYGIYLILWFGDKRTKKMSSPPKELGIIKPTTPEELQKALESQIKAKDKDKIAVVVIDVTQP